MVPGISEKTGSTTSFIHSDRMGSMKALSASATVSDTADYDAFGKVISRTGSSATQKGFASGYGYQEDGESGYKLLGHRYYDADSGRFLSRDRAKDGRNWYGYCGNNPIKTIDPNGLQRMTYFYAIEDKDTTDLLKYGITYSPAKRYPKWFYEVNNARMRIIGFGPRRPLVRGIEYDSVKLRGGPLNRESFSASRGPKPSGLTAALTDDSILASEEAEELAKSGIYETELELQSVAEATAEQSTAYLRVGNILAEINLEEAVTLAITEEEAELESVALSEGALEL